MTSIYPIQKINLLDFDRSTLKDFLKKLGEKSFRADQIIQWIHQFGVQNFDEMTNLSMAMRDYLKQNTEIRPPRLLLEKKSVDGTQKWLLEVENGDTVETVYIPEEGRGTLCISSQVGCPLNCVFCATGKQGFKRNLKISEIIGQLWFAVRKFSEHQGKHDRKITNVVLMGMGEPLLNFDNVLRALNIMMDDLAYSFSKYRVTVSTSGIVPMMYELSEMSSASLAVSLHAPNNKLRSQLMPINQKYPLAELMAVCRSYFKKDKRRKISFEYIMLKGINDKQEYAKQLLQLVHSIPCKFNLIPYNETMCGAFQSSSKPTIDAFRNILFKAGIPTITRKQRGADIDAACGQLKGLYTHFN